MSDAQSLLGEKETNTVSDAHRLVDEMENETKSKVQ